MINFIINLTIRKKLFVIITVTFFLFIISFLGNFFVLNKVKVGGILSDNIELYHNNLETIALLKSDLIIVRNQLLNFIYERDSGKMSQLQKGIVESSEKIDTSFKNMQAAISEEDIKVTLKASQFTWTEFKNTRDKVLIPAILAGNREGAREIAGGIQARRYNRFIEQTDCTINSIELVIEDLRNAADEIVTSNTIYLSLFNGILLIIIIAITFFIGNLIVKSIRQLTERTRDLSEGEGDLTIEIDIRSRDETGLLAGYFNKFVARISEVIRDTSLTADQLSVSSTEMSSSTMAFSENAQSQAASAEEIMASVEEISAGMDSVASIAENQQGNMNSLMQRIDILSDIITGMSSQVKEALGTSGAITEKARSGEQSLGSMNESMRKIGDSSNKMTDIIKIINNISDQINLLSLNAAIEAARAGDAGRGFAVVADEISKLADKTAQSLKDIDSLIKTNESEIGKGISIVNVTVDTIGTIIRGVNTVADMMKSIFDFMEKQQENNTLLINEATQARISSEEIRSATDEQKIAISEIVKTISNINEKTQTNASGAEEMAGNSEEISGMAETLKMKVGFFKV